ncbi:LacI family transcriptional regulator [Pseudonocardia sulfidoxydans NBRC 16205]|uniref:LacI family transcriptional regulator n=2 Tax=Pseudonocardia sulfidoxydans TaxID=54011 RepID=A0A511DMR9_9PSEU|nr:substrate-binding domain-containing protein [Pseudonocardia sulfidoxydans]GEL25553.1 LacI family transcriptional regulator [Pseudonocardia sulfidoxydans NBRC 16205]
MSLPHLDRSGRPTLRTVAELAGVHVSTVSRALSDSPSANERSGSQRTIARIREIAAEVGFERNPHGSGLRTSRSSLLGVLVPRLSDVVLATIYEGIEDSARARGYQTFVVNGRDEPAIRRERLQMLLARRVDGIVLGDAHGDADELAATLAERGTPFVLTNRHSAAHVSVTCDDLLGGRLAAEHLLDLGHTALAVVAGEPYASTGRDRTAGFLQVCAERGVEVPPERIVHAQFDVDGGRGAAGALLASPAPPTGMFVVNDFAAIGAMGAARAAGLTVGTDVAIVGYNDIPLASQLPVPLTSVASPMHEMGVRAAETLIAAIDGRPVESLRLPPTLSVRESSTGVLEPTTL